MNKVKITPVKGKVIPRYPDQYSTQLNSFLLENKPLRWKAAPVAGAALSTAVMLGLTGCGTVTMGEPNANITTTATSIFDESTGITDGMIAIPQAFLSEDDAFVIIKDEFEKLSLTVKRGDNRVNNIQIPVVEDNEGKTRTEKGDLDFDMSIQGTNVFMEFISVNQITSSDYLGSSFGSYSYKDFSKPAKILNTNLNSLNYENRYGVFYDPAEDENWAIVYEHRREEARQRASDALREQIRDFIEWLSGQGII